LGAQRQPWDRIWGQRKIASNHGDAATHRHTRFQKGEGWWPGNAIPIVEESTPLDVKKFDANEAGPWD